MGFVHLLCLGFLTIVNHIQVVNDPFPLAKNIHAKVQGFEIQEILKGSGEYLSIATDPQGRLIISPRYGNVLRATVNTQDGILSIDTLDLGVQDCQGLLYAYNHLYAMGTGDNSIRGIYRIPDRSGHGDYGPPRLMKEIPRNGDHSGHTIALGPDGMLYFLSGNANEVPQGDDVSYINDDWHDDHPMMLGSIYGAGQNAPGGYVLRTDSVGTHWTLYAMGLRNPYDMCFNAEGELFTYDSDMEWDFNLPWYRPTRVNHLVSGSDFAWRKFNAKRFDYYPDIWPAVKDFGRGSPTATVFGTQTNFPEKYQRALFLGDWSYGKIYAMHLKEKGSTYDGEYEVFATGKPLNITDMIAGHDGALYFVTGGNGTDTGLFRISWTGQNAKKAKLATSEMRSLRKKIETYHSATDTSGLSLAFKFIGHPDPFIRYAARIILERNDPVQWNHIIDDIENTLGTMNILTALLRSDHPDQYRTEIFDLLQSMNLVSAQPQEQAGWLRLVNLWVLRDTALPEDYLRKLIPIIESRYPASHVMVNREMSRALASLYGNHSKATAFLEKTFGLIETSEDSKMIVHYLEMIRHVPMGWTPQLQNAFLYWTEYAINHWTGGSLYTYFVKTIQEEFLGHLSKDQIAALNEDERAPYVSSYDGPFKKKNITRIATGAPNTFVQNWSYEDLEYSLELVNSPRGSGHRNLQRGYQMLERGLCFNCHFIHNRGGSFGPELTLASNSFGVEELLRTTIYPSEAINSRFQSTEFELKANGFARGRVMHESETHYVIQLDWTGNTTEEIPKESIVKMKPSQVSDMPPALINSMTKNEILDMLYFISELPGNIEDPTTFHILENKSYAHFGDSVLVEVINYSGEGEIFICSEEENYKPYTGPFYVYNTSFISAYKELADTVSEIQSRVIHFFNPDENGLNFKVYSGITKRFKPITHAPNLEGIARSFDITQVVQDIDNFEIHLEGYLEIDQSGEYIFSAKFDDALKLYIDNQLVIHEKNKRWGGSSSQCIYLDKGRVPVRAVLYDELVTELLELQYEGPGFDRKVVPADKLYFKDE